MAYLYLKLKQLLNLVKKFLTAYVLTKAFNSGFLKFRGSSDVNKGFFLPRPLILIN